jgi:hypothetical protein
MRAYGRRIVRKIPLDAAANDIVGYFRIDFSFSEHVFWRSATVLVCLGGKKREKNSKIFKIALCLDEFHPKIPPEKQFDFQLPRDSRHRTRKKGKQNKEKIHQHLNPPSVLDA